MVSEMVPRAEKSEVSSIGVSPLVSVSGKTVVRSEVQGKDYVLADREAELLLACRPFRSITEHTTALEGRSRLKQMKEVLDKLRLYRLLITRDEFRHALVGGEKTKEVYCGITHMGIPTKNRPELLKRCCTSYIANAKQYGRRVRVCIVDDSREGQRVAAGKHAALELMANHDVPIRYITRAFRRKLARQIAEVSGVPVEVARFALVGDEQIDASYGAARNTLLLMTAGHLTLQVDDDSECNIRTLKRSRDAIHFSSRLPQEFWYFDREEEVDVEFPMGETDILQHHEHMLGRSIAAVVNLQKEAVIDAGAIHAPMVKALRQEGASIGISQVGWYGDAGVNNTLYRLMHTGQSFDRLTRSKDVYRRQLSTRITARTAAEWGVYSGTALMGVSMGIDNRSVLPPFLPVGRNEDAVFGHVLRGCFPAKFIGFLPGFLIRHAPGERRAKLLPRFEPYTGAAIISVMIDQFVPGINAGPAEAMHVVASGLKCIASTSDREFESYLQQICAEQLIGKVNYLEHLMETRTGAPEFWHKDIEAITRTMKNALLQHRVVFREKDEDARRKALHKMRELVYNFSLVLNHWPAMLQCARYMALAEN